MKNRFLSLLAVLCLIAVMVPAPARADGGTAGPGSEMTGEAVKALIDSAKSGDTVKLTGNCETSLAYILVSKALTIDLGGHTLTFHTPSEGLSQGVYASGAKVILQNGFIQSDSTGTSTALFVSNSGSIALEGVTVTASSKGSAYAATLRGGSLTVDSGSSLTSSTNAAVYGYGSDANAVDISGKVTHTGTFSAVQSSYVSSTGPMDINVHDGAKIDGGEGAGILMMAPGKVTVDGGTITSESSGIVMTKGELTVSGGEITGKGEYQSFKGTADYHVYDNGAAVYVEPVATGTKVTVSGGKLTSEKSYALSAPKEGNKTADHLTVSITGGTFLGGGGKGALDAGGEAGFLSGGTFSSPVDSTYLGGSGVYVRKDAGGSFTYGTPDKLLTSAGDAVYKPDSLNSDGTVKKTVNVRFNFGDGTTTEVKQDTDYPAAVGAVIKLPTSVTRSGYAFDGWKSGDANDTALHKGTYTVPDPGEASAVTLTASFSFAPSALTGYVTILGEPWVGETLTAVVTSTNNTGTLHYQWLANGVYLSGETLSTLVLTGYEAGKTISCMVTSSVQTGSIIGRLWSVVDYYNNRYSPSDGSAGNTSGTNQGGNSGASSENGNSFTIETPIFTTTANKDGSKTTTVIEPDGSSGLIVLTSYGTVSSASMRFSSDAFKTAQLTGSSLTLPTTVQSSRSADSAVPVRIILPQATGSVSVKIPVSQMTAGTVAVMENSFGPDTVIRSSVSESNGVRFALTGSAVVKIVDNSKSFQDVSDGAWYTSAVKWASSRDVMNGVGSQKFDPQGTVDRATMAQMLYNFDGTDSTGTTSQFSDVSSKDWYAVSVAWATRNGIARNYGNRFGAKDALTREDMAVMLYNYVKLIGYNPYASGNTSAFSDNGNISDWARNAMQWAVGVGLINGTQNGTRTVVLDPQGTVTRAQLATIMQRFNNLY